jgi:hypothetical protein
MGPSLLTLKGGRISRPTDAKAQLPTAPNGQALADKPDNVNNNAKKGQVVDIDYFDSLQRSMTTHIFTSCFVEFISKYGDACSQAEPTPIKEVACALSDTDSEEEKVGRILKGKGARI